MQKKHFTSILVDIFRVSVYSHDVLNSVKLKITDNSHIYIFSKAQSIAYNLVSQATDSIRVIEQVISKAFCGSNII